MKKFVVGQLVDEDNICNLEKEKAALNRYVDTKRKVLIYAPRNFGKTSLVKNVVIERFKNKQKKSFVLFVDFMSVKSIDSITQRIKRSFELEFKATFPIKSIADELKKYVRSASATFELDSIKGESKFQLNFSKQESAETLQELFDAVEQIAKNIPTIVVFDEFQDIAFIEEAEGLFRPFLESSISFPMFLMGSKNHLLASIFSKPRAPLANWGTDLTFEPIPYELYHRYILERFESRKLIINLKTATFLQDLMNRIPEAINTLCIQILDFYESQFITEKEVLISLKNLLTVKSKRFEAALSHYSENEERLLTFISSQEFVKKPQSKETMIETNLSHRAIAYSINKFLDEGTLEKTEQGYRMTDPLLKFYLTTFR